MGELVTLRKKIRHVCRRKEDKTILFYQIQRQFGEIWNRIELKSVDISLIQVCWCGGLNTDPINYNCQPGSHFTVFLAAVNSPHSTCLVTTDQRQRNMTKQSLLLLQSQETMDCKYRILLSFLHWWLLSAAATVLSGSQNCNCFLNICLPFSGYWEIANLAILYLQSILETAAAL